MNAKYIAILGIALAGGSYYIHNNFKAEELSTIESIRSQAEEARIRSEEAEKNRLAAEDKLSQALYDSCYSQAVSLSGIAFDEKQRRAYNCWKQELTNTNGTGKLAPASEPPLGTIISNTSNHVTNKSTVRSDNEKSSGSRSEVQQAQQTQGKGVATSGKNGPKILVTQAVAPTRGTVSKGKEANYWMAYETAVKLIRKWEGLRLKSYWDFSHCSIGYGFSYPCGKSITQKQADKMLSDRVHQDLKVIRSDFPKLDSEAQGALVSFKHNCPAGYKSVSKNGLKYFSSWCKSAGGKRLQGLVNRRSAEWKIISK